MLGLFGFLSVFTDDLREPTRNGVLIALTLLHNGLAMYCLGQTVLPNRRYGFAVLGSLLTMTGWGWMVFATIPIAITLLGVLAGLVMGFWGLMVLKNPEVRSQFKDQWLPAEKWWQRFSAPVITGAAGGGGLAVIFCFGFLLWLTTGERSPNGYPTNYGYPDFGPGGLREPPNVPGATGMRPPREMKQREIKSRSGRTADEIRADEEDDDSPKKSAVSNTPTSDPDPDVQSMINAGTYTPEAARNIRAIKEAAKNH